MCVSWLPLHDNGDAFYSACLWQCAQVDSVDFHILSCILIPFSKNPQINSVMNADDDRLFLCPQGCVEPFSSAARWRWYYTSDKFHKQLFALTPTASLDLALCLVCWRKLRTRRGKKNGSIRWTIVLKWNFHFLKSCLHVVAFFFFLPPSADLCVNHVSPETLYGARSCPDSIKSIEPRNHSVWCWACSGTAGLYFKARQVHVLLCNDAWLLCILASDRHLKPNGTVIKQICRKPSQLLLLFGHLVNCAIALLTKNDRDSIIRAADLNFRLQHCWCAAAWAACNQLSDSTSLLSRHNWLVPFEMRLQLAHCGRRRSAASGVPLSWAAPMPHRRVISVFTTSSVWKFKSCAWPGNQSSGVFVLG